MTRLLVLVALTSLCVSEVAAQSRMDQLEQCRATIGRPIVQRCLQTTSNNLESCRSEASPAVRRCMQASMGGRRAQRSGIYSLDEPQPAPLNRRPPEHASTRNVREAGKDSRPAQRPAKPIAVAPVAARPAEARPADARPAEVKAAVAEPSPVQQREPVSLPVTAEFGRRVALVIGNGNYAHVPALPNAINDARALGSALEVAGFQSVTVKLDLTREQTIAALRDFAQQADGADWAVVYYSGHGIEHRGVNYMIPVDASLLADRDIDLEAIEVNKAMAVTESARKMRLVILDACRNNPFLEQMKRAVATRSITRGLARIEPDAGTLIIYSAKHGELALDGDSANSPFATALLKRMRTPHLEIRRLFDLVRDDVMAATNRRQQPYSYGSLSGSEDFYFSQQ
jgi:hypothetical protein